MLHADGRAADDVGEGLNAMQVRGWGLSASGNWLSRRRRGYHADMVKVKLI